MSQRVRGGAKSLNRAVARALHALAETAGFGEATIDIEVVLESSDAVTELTQDLVVFGQAPQRVALIVIEIGRGAIYLVSRLERPSPPSE
jgi:hypothetical protein